MRNERRWWRGSPASPWVLGDVRVVSNRTRQKIKIGKVTWRRGGSLMLGLDPAAWLPRGNRGLANLSAKSNSPRMCRQASSLRRWKMLFVVSLRLSLFMHNVRNIRSSSRVLQKLGRLHLCRATTPGYSLIHFGGEWKGPKNG